MMHDFVHVDAFFPLYLHDEHLFIYDHFNSQSRRYGAMPYHHASLDYRDEDEEDDDDDDGDGDGDV